jgi:DNA repair protein RecO (recombination protein O)
MLLKVKGVVIRSVDIKDSDKLITLYTEEKGIVTAIANGSKTLKSRYMAATQLFCYGNYVLYKKGDFFFVREVELIESFFDLRLTIERTALATYICDVINYVGVSEMPDVPLLRLTLNSLFAISKEKHSLPKIKSAFELRCASILGFSPDISACFRCEKKHGEFYLDILGGRILCSECKSKVSLAELYPNYGNDTLSKISYVSEGVRAAMEYVISCPIEKFLSFTLSEEESGYFSDVSEAYLLNHIEKSFKSLDFYKQMIR